MDGGTCYFCCNIALWFTCICLFEIFQNDPICTFCVCVCRIFKLGTICNFNCFQRHLCRSREGIQKSRCRRNGFHKRHFLFKIFSFNKEQERFTIFLPIMFKPQTKNHSKKKSMISEKVAQILIRKRRKKIPSWFYSLSRGMSEDGGDGITFYHTL